MKISRSIHGQLLDAVKKSNKVVLLYGPRQAGKTTLSQDIISRSGLKCLSVNADQFKYVDALSSRDLNTLRSLTEGYELLFIDEGQRVPDIGLNLKILHDEIPNLRILVTGSSSFLLSSRVTESLAGRKKVFTLLPVSMNELATHYNSFELDDMLDERLIFGSYPEVITQKSISEKEEYLRDISSSYIYKDILELEQIKYPYKIRDLLKLLAFQIGSQVSIHELCKNLSLNRDTVERYLNLLEQTFVIYKLPSYSKNPRKEISKSVKYYFYDNGIRNILIDNLKSFKDRDDTGALWENFIITERKKYLLYHRKNVNSWFWRTYSGTEIDYIEESGGDLSAFEIKKSNKVSKAPKFWKENYNSSYLTVNRDNYMQFISEL